MLLENPLILAESETSSTNHPITRIHSNILLLFRLRKEGHIHPLQHFMDYREMAPDLYKVDCQLVCATNGISPSAWRIPKFPPSAVPTSPIQTRKMKRLFHDDLWSKMGRYKMWTTCLSVGNLKICGRRDTTFNGERLS